MPRLRHHEPSSSSDSACVASSASRRSSLVHDGGRLSFPLNRVAPELRCLRIQFWIDERLTPNSSAKSSCVLSPTRARSTTFALSSSEYCILTSSAPLNLRATRGDIYPDTGGGRTVCTAVRAEHTKLCALVVVGVNERGEKRFLAIEDGARESAQSWRRCFARDEYSAGDRGRCDGWCAGRGLRWHPPATVLGSQDDELNCVPRSVQAKTKQALHAIW